MNDTRTLVMRTDKKARKVYRKHSREVRVTAVFFVFAMAFSAFGANLTSIMKLLEVYATAADGTVHDETDYYEAALTLYDYYSDVELKSSVPCNDGYPDGGKNLNTIFNHDQKRYQWQCEKS